ncbi:hypothetical protein SynPROS71_01784 [Synechococcus sp. PROS-7-1]|nr:hypothetical protein [Synechococcus sp. PROS-7-1]QNI85567.1 hypothetical protein SynPROS71_01784 [Synechococcus sp. PROS-7-1]
MEARLMAGFFDAQVLGTASNKNMAGCSRALSGRKFLVKPATERSVP